MASDSSAADSGAAPSITVNEPTPTRATVDPFVVDALPEADLEVVGVTLQAVPGPIVPGVGAAYTFDIEVANNGPSPAYGAVLVNAASSTSQWILDRPRPRNRRRGSARARAAPVDGRRSPFPRATNTRPVNLQV